MSTEKKETKQKVNYFNSRRYIIYNSKRKSQNSKPPLYRKTNEKKKVNDDEDYSGLAYKPPKGNKRNSFPKRMSGDTNDFRTKWKTEICHYWEVNGFCKYGDSVSINLNIS